MNFEVKYGLPREVKFCTKCVLSNQSPNSAVEFKHTIKSKKETVAFDEHGVCDACKFSDLKKAQINWKDRESELIELSKSLSAHPGKYNCIVPGSGGKDSFYQSHILKYKYGFRPLTVTWAPHLYTTWGWQNHQAWIHSGFDNLTVTPNGLIHRLFTRLAVDNLFHPFQPFMLGQKGLAPRIAAQLDIPLIFFGENEAEYGNPISDNFRSNRDANFHSKDSESAMFLGGVEESELINKYGVPEYELQQYRPIDPHLLQDKKIEVRYLGYYLRWHPQSAYYYAVENGGFIPSPERTPGTYSKYNSIDDKIDDLHYWTSYIKFGLGRATYDASQEIRNEEITREEAVSLVKKFDGEWPARFEVELMDYLSINEKFGEKILKNFKEPKMDKTTFISLADKFRSEHLWEKSGDEWKLRHAVYDNLSTY